MKRVRCKVCGKLKAVRPYFKWFCEHCARAEMVSPAVKPEPLGNPNVADEK